MKFHKCFYLLLGTFLILTILPSEKLWASSVSIEAAVDRTEATPEDYILLKLIVKGGRQEPSLPSMPAFTVKSRGSSSQVRIVNGQMSSSVEYSYLLYPKKTGVFTLGPFTITDSGKTIQSNKIVVTIRATPRQQKKSSRDIFVVAEVDKENVYLFEEIIYSFKFYRKVKVANARLTDTPAFEGFLTESIDGEKEYRELINGETYLVTEIKQALFSTKTGVLQISPSTLNCDIVVQKRRRQGFGFFDDPFFGYAESVPKVLRTSPITIMVKSLPIAGKPPDFKNLVGNFSLTSDLNKKKIEVGESLTLTLNLTGTGNIKNYQKLTVKGLEDFKVYDDKPVFQSKVIRNRVGGTLVIKKALVPLKEGPLKIPLISVSYFDPIAGTYKSATTGPYVLEVMPSAEKEKFHVVEAQSQGGSKEEIKILGEDILPIHTSLDALSSRKIKPVSVISIVFLLFPAFGFVSFMIARRFKERNHADQWLGRSRNAHRVYRQKLPDVKRALQNEDAVFYQLASKALKDFIGDKLSFPGNALTSKELEKRLSEARVPEVTVRDLQQLFNLLDSGQFGVKSYSSDERKDAFKSMEKLVKEINKRVKK